MGKRLGIVGSRHFPRRELVSSFIQALPQNIVIVSGGAEGVDRWAIETGNSLGLTTVVFRADWEKLGRKAGPIRNAEFVKNIDELVAFWDGRSRGTLNTIVLAIEANLPVRVFDSAGEPLATESVLQQAQQRGVIAAIRR